MLTHQTLQFLGQVESRDSDRGKTPSKKSKKSSHKSPKKSRKSTEFQAKLKTIDEKWSELFARLEAMFLATSFTAPVEPVQRGDMVVTDRLFIPQEQQSTGATGQKQLTGQMMNAATQPVEAPGATSIATATQPVEAPGADTEMLHTNQDASLFVAVDRPGVQPPGPANKMSAGGRSEVQPQDPTGQPTTTERCASLLTSSAVPVEDPGALEENVSDRLLALLIQSAG